MRVVAPLTILFVSLLLTGCATTPTPAANAKLTTPERLLAFQDKLLVPSGTLVITRDVGHKGSGCYNSVTINGKLAARLDVGERSSFIVPAGEVLMRAGRDSQGRGLCGTGQDDWTQRETTIKPDEIKQFRLSIDANGKAEIQRSE